jgi:chromosome segregation ATPase
VTGEEERERKKNVEEGRALFSAYQGSVQQLATGMIAVGERLERSNQLLEMLVRQQGQLVQQNQQLAEGQAALVEHLAALQRQVAVQVELQGQSLGIPIQHVQPAGGPVPGFVESMGAQILNGLAGQFMPRGQPMPNVRPPWEGG